MATEVRTTLTEKASNGIPQGWRKVRFGDVVKNVNAQERNPLENGLERFVGLEHLDTDSLHIRRWGAVEDGTTFTRKFVNGQVLFSKRRVYLRKAAIADFDGVCSGDILVFEANHERLLPELLPFIVQSDEFFNHAEQTSAGSLSPRTKWKDLARYEFLIPPVDEQQRIEEILRAAEEATFTTVLSLEELEQTKNSVLTASTTTGVSNEVTKESHLGSIPSQWSIRTVGELLSQCQYGLSNRSDSSGDYPILGMVNIEKGKITEPVDTFVSLSEQDFATYHMKDGDILFNRTNSAELVGKVGIYRLKGDHVFASYLVRLRTIDELVRPDYLNYYLNSDPGQRRVRAYATPGVSQSNINASNLKKVLVPLPPLHEQEQIISLIEGFDASFEKLHEHLARLNHLKKTIQTNLLTNF